MKLRTHQYLLILLFITSSTSLKLNLNENTVVSENLNKEEIKETPKSTNSADINQTTCELLDREDVKHSAPSRLTATDYLNDLVKKEEIVGRFSDNEKEKFDENKKSPFRLYHEMSFGEKANTKKEIENEEKHKTEEAKMIEKLNNKKSYRKENYSNEDDVGVEKLAYEEASYYDFQMAEQIGGSGNIVYMDRQNFICDKDNSAISEFGYKMRPTKGSDFLMAAYGKCIRHPNISNNCKDYSTLPSSLNNADYTNSFNYLDRVTPICPRGSVMKKYGYRRKNINYYHLSIIYTCCDAIITKSTQGVTAETKYADMKGYQPYSWIYLYRQYIKALPNNAITGFKLYVNYAKNAFSYAVTQSQIFTGK